MRGIAAWWKAQRRAAESRGTIAALEGCETVIP